MNLWSANHTIVLLHHVLTQLPELYDLQAGRVHVLTWLLELHDLQVGRVLEEEVIRERKIEDRQDAKTMSLPHATWDPTVCPSCGQLHEPQGTHLYDYYQAVDEDLICQICLQPLVSPLDTRCGHTFCARCLRNYLRIQRQCPIDRKALSLKECQLSSILVRR